MERLVFTHRKYKNNGTTVTFLRPEQDIQKDWIVLQEVKKKQLDGP